MNLTILRLVTHFVDLAGRIYQLYFLQITLRGFKHVGVKYDANKMVLNNI